MQHPPIVFTSQKFSMHVVYDDLYKYWSVYIRDRLYGLLAVVVVDNIVDIRRAIAKSIQRYQDMTTNTEICNKNCWLLFYNKYVAKIEISEDNSKHGYCGTFLDMKDVVNFCGDTFDEAVFEGIVSITEYIMWKIEQWEEDTSLVEEQLAS